MLEGERARKRGLQEFNLDEFFLATYYRRGSRGSWNSRLNVARTSVRRDDSRVLSWREPRRFTPLRKHGFGHVEPWRDPRIGKSSLCITELIWIPDWIRTNERFLFFYRLAVPRLGIRRGRGDENRSRFQVWANFSWPRLAKYIPPSPSKRFLLHRFVSKWFNNDNSRIAIRTHVARGIEV